MWYIAKPDHLIRLANEQNAANLMTFCKQRNLAKIAYGFLHMSPISNTLRFMKFGRSGKSIGERVYRQAGHIPGFRTRLLGSPGSDTKEVILRYEEKYPEETVCKNDVSLAIWDVTNMYNPNAVDPVYNTRRCENALLDEHVKLFGELPVGNIKDTRNEMIKPYVAKTLLNELFHNF